MTLETQMFQNAHSGSQWLLPPLTMLLLFAFADRQTADLLKAVVKRDPPWIQVLKEDTVTLTCEGTHNPGNSSTQWFHNQSSTWGQVQASYTFKATVNDSGEYRCRMEETSLSDPVHLEVISDSEENREFKKILLRKPDWLLLQTPQLVFLEGERITLRCHGWKNIQLARISFFQNGEFVSFHPYNVSYSIPNANHSHSGDYYCKANLRRTEHVSKPVTITVQGSATASTTSLVWFHAAFCLVMCLLFAVDTGLYFYVRRNLQTSGEDWRRSLSVGKHNAPQDK